MNKLFRFAYILWEYRSVLLTIIHENYRFTKWYKWREILNQFDIMYMNSKRDISIIQWFWPWFYGVWHSMLYTLADMWVWCKKNNYIRNITELKNNME